MPVDKLSLSGGAITTPGAANPPKARAMEALARKWPDLDKPGRPEDKEIPANAAEARMEVNRGLVQSMFGDDATRDAKAMRINYQEAITQLEAVLSQELGDENFSLAELARTTSGVEGQADYWSPENTAERIVAGATGFFDAFQRQNPDLSEEEQLDKFLGIITPAIEQGFAEAFEILQGFGVFEGSIQDNALQTQQLVNEKLSAFRERMAGQE